MSNKQKNRFKYQNLENKAIKPNFQNKTFKRFI